MEVIETKSNKKENKMNMNFNKRKKEILRMEEAVDSGYFVPYISKTDMSHKFKSNDEIDENVISKIWYQYEMLYRQLSWCLMFESNTKYCDNIQTLDFMVFDNTQLVGIKNPVLENSVSFRSVYLVNTDSLETFDDLFDLDEFDLPVTSHPSLSGIEDFNTHRLDLNSETIESVVNSLSNLNGGNLNFAFDPCESLWENFPPSGYHSIPSSMKYSMNPACSINIL
jgi:hypothetical protein